MVGDRRGCFRGYFRRDCHEAARQFVTRNGALQRYFSATQRETCAAGDPHHFHDHCAVAALAHAIQYSARKTEVNMLRLLLAATSFTLLAAMPCAHAAGVEQLEANKKTVAAFEDAALNQKDFDAASKYLGSRYTQHNPSAADGPEGLKGYIAFLKD